MKRREREGERERERQRERERERQRETERERNPSDSYAVSYGGNMSPFIQLFNTAALNIPREDTSSCAINGFIKQMAPCLDFLWV